MVLTALQCSALHCTKVGPTGYGWVLQASANRSVGATNMNAQSSRSHSVFVVHLAQVRRPTAVAEF